MKSTKPNRLWFILAYPIGYAIAWLVLFCRIIAESREGGTALCNIGEMALFSAWGFLCFPIGILGAFVWDSRFFENADSSCLAVGIGWFAYLTVIVLGICRPSWRVVYVFVALIVLNIAGCQCDHTMGAFSWSS